MQMFNVSSVYIVYAKYQMASTKALAHLISLCMHYLSTNKTLIKKQNVKKMAKFKTVSFCQKVPLWHQTSSCKCSVCLHCARKVSDGISKSSGTS